ncbi:MAG: hypothetical protein PHC34_04915 [Candidatus Gastranaerophilales bacterium]|nr:hypothetical protein [Candidatus Gastranaerophilales bacterium]
MNIKYNLPMPEEIEIKEDKVLRLIGLELMFSNPQNRENLTGITAIELSRKHKLSIDIVKKKLNILQKKGLVLAIGNSPKYWKFNDYNFLRMDEEDPVYLTLCCFDDVDFDQFFNYQ